MSLIVKEGNYLTLGAIVIKNQVIFTFEGEKEDNCRIVLIHKTTKEKEYIDVPQDYCMGSLRSVIVSGFVPQEYDYLYEINGEEVLDPYARVIIGRERWNDESRKENHYKLLGGFQMGSFPWGEDKNPEVAKEDMIMYKLHVRGFSMGLKTAGKTKGTFQAIRNKIPYLKDLGITTVELMPMYEFEEMPVPKEVKLPDYVKCIPEGEKLIKPVVMDQEVQNLNYWGYGLGNYFAVKASYAMEPQKASIEFKKLVKSLHENGMECVMEMCFPEKINHNLIMDVLHYWIREYHVDGFHIMGANLPIISIEQDPILSRTKIFADGFSAGGYDTKRKYTNLYVYRDEYQFPARRLLNHYECDVRDFVNQQKKQGANVGFVNYITNNNGFTLADLFMYVEKRNQANGEKNADGTDCNLSNNYGVEGPSRKRHVVEVRQKHLQMAFAMLMFAQGVPLIYAGDEFGNTQGGNNNAYCQDNEIGWLNWSQFARYKEDREILKKLIAFRKNHGLLNRPTPFTFHDDLAVGAPDFSYHGESAWINQIDPGKKCVGVMYCGAYAPTGIGTEDIYIGYNFYLQDVKLALPFVQCKEWYLNGEKVENQQYVDIPAHSIVVLLTKDAPKKELPPKTEKANKKKIVRK